MEEYCNQNFILNIYKYFSEKNTQYSGKFSQVQIFAKMPKCREFLFSQFLFSRQPKLFN